MSSYRQTHPSLHNHTHLYSSPNYFYRNHQQQEQQRGYNPRHSNYQSSRQHHNIHNDPHANYSSFRGNGSYTTTDHHDEYFARQFWDHYQIPVSQPHLPYYQQIDDVYVATIPSELIQSTRGSMFDYIDFMTSQLIDQERNSRIGVSSLDDYVFSLIREDHTYDHVEENEGDDDVLKYLKLRTHYAPAKDGVNSELVADVESSEICAICQSEYEDKENIGALQCGHEFHMDCIKQWLSRKKDCPMCRASVLPSQG